MDHHAEPLDPTTVMTDEIRWSDLATARFINELLAYGLNATRSASWPTSAASLDHLDGIDFHEVHPGQEQAIVSRGGPAGLTIGRARVSLSDGRVHVIGAATSPAEALATVEWVRDQCPLAEIDESLPRVPITFWSLSPHGPSARTRVVDVPTWADVAENYPQEIGEHLERLMGSEFLPGRGGQLVLWQGEPGTGKTWALRALAWQWRTWADIHYITDPETFFGNQASYMLDVLLHEEGQAILGDDEQDAKPDPDPRASAGRWRLLVLEDTGELMSADARERAGQGLSRLLNVVDGLIGQGLRILVLVTTNEKLRTLHPAVQRPGRCAALLDFPTFSFEEAREWLVARGLTHEQAKAATGGASTLTVADLFAVLEERRVSVQPALGFAS